jgi:hypothetical protein
VDPQAEQSTSSVDTTTAALASHFWDFITDQERSNSLRAVGLLSPGDTRWNCILVMLRRLVRLKRAFDIARTDAAFRDRLKKPTKVLNYSADLLTDDQWDSISYFVRLLSPFERVTLVSQLEGPKSSTASIVGLKLFHLANILQLHGAPTAASFRNLRNDAAETLLTQLRIHFQTYFQNVSPPATVSLLHSDPIIFPILLDFRTKDKIKLYVNDVRPVARVNSFIGESVFSNCPYSM